jgi:hypothetical protein
MTVVVPGSINPAFEAVIKESNKRIRAPLTLPKSPALLPLPGTTMAMVMSLAPRRRSALWMNLTKSVSTTSRIMASPVF